MYTYMRAFFAFLITYIAGGLWLFTHPGICGAFCFSPDLTVIIWFILFLLLSLFLLFVFPAVPLTDARDIVSICFLVALGILLVYEAISAFVFWLPHPA